MAEEFGPEAAASGGVDAWASIHARNSERDVQRVVKEQETTLKVPISQLQIQQSLVEWISPRSWMEFILQRGLLYMLSGLVFEERDSIRSVWRHFWNRYEQLHPHFALFDCDYDLSRVISTLHTLRRRPDVEVAGLDGDDHPISSRDWFPGEALEETTGAGASSRQLCWPHVYDSLCGQCDARTSMPRIRASSMT